MNTQEKIARSLFAHESKLAGSFYGKYFARNLNLYLLQRRPDEWRTQQAQAHVQAKQGVKPTATVAAAAAQKGKRDVDSATKEVVEVVEEKDTGKKRKRGGKGKADDIDELFEAALGKKMKKGSLAVPSIHDDGQPAPADGVIEAEYKDEGAERAEKKRRKEEKKEKKKRKSDGDGEGGEDKTLEGVLGAIKAAPKGQEKGRGKSKKNKDR